MRFWKYHGTGNDFVLLEALDGRPGWLTPDAVRKVCERRFGVGADGILLIEKGIEAPWFMRILNSDGSEAEMCGNGIRCVARHLRERMGVVEQTVLIETLAGIKPCTITADMNGMVSGVLVGLGRPATDREDIPLAGSGDTLDLSVSALGRDFTGHGIGMGNPHFVVFEGLDEESARRYGSVLSTSPLFPKQANIEFAAQKGPDHFEVRVYERGVGLTMACGTGAGATAVAAVLTGRSGAGRRIRIDLPGGTLHLTVADDLTDVVLDGPAVLVFEGELALNVV